MKLTLGGTIVLWFNRVPFRGCREGLQECPGLFHKVSIPVYFSQSSILLLFRLKIEETNEKSMTASSPNYPLSNYPTLSQTQNCYDSPLNINFF